MAAALIKIENLTKYYGKAIGVEGISFEVKKGEIFGFLGPNGAGKTTTIRLLLDMLRPSDGQISVFGKEVRKHSKEIRQRCGYLPGDFSAYGNMTGQQFLRFTASLRRGKYLAMKELFQRFELSESVLLQKVKRLSHGTIQKLGIIQAIAHRPELIILDEPTSGLDPLMQDAFYNLLAQLQKEGHTIFFSSHNLAEVEKNCHRVAIIREGKLVGCETLENLKKKRYRKLRFVLDKAVDQFELADTELLKQEDLCYEFLVKGDMKLLLHQLSKLPIADVEFPEPDLEEVFLGFYRE